jgi:hypothetical protein
MRTSLPQLQFQIAQVASRAAPRCDAAYYLVAGRFTPATPSPLLLRLQCGFDDGGIGLAEVVPVGQQHDVSHLCVGLRGHKAMKSEQLSFRPGFRLSVRNAQVAKAAAPYCHARLNAVETTSVGLTSNGWQRCEH